MDGVVVSQLDTDLRLGDLVVIVFESFNYRFIEIIKVSYGYLHL
jgi:hypothetical protein